MLSVTVPAPDLSLLSIAELRAAAGIDDRSQDAELRKLGLRVAARIAAHCNIRRDGPKPATLRQETIVETFRLEPRHAGRTSVIILARRPVASVVYLAFDDVTQDLEKLTVNASAGLVDWCQPLRHRHVEISYVAGWQDVPDDLKLAASALVQQYLAASAQEPGLRSISIPNVEERQYWIGHPTDPDIPQNIADMLAPYRNEDGAL